MMIQILKIKLEIINQILARKNMEIKIKKKLKKKKTHNKYLIKNKIYLTIHNRYRKFKMKNQMTMNFILLPLIKCLKIMRYPNLVNLKIIKILDSKNKNKAQMMMNLL